MSARSSRPSAAARPVARVRLSPAGTGKITVSGKAHDKFFTVYELRGRPFMPQGRGP